MTLKCTQQYQFTAGFFSGLSQYASILDDHPVELSIVGSDVSTVHSNKIVAMHCARREDVNGAKVVNLRLTEADANNRYWAAFEFFSEDEEGICTLLYEEDTQLQADQDKGISYGQIAAAFVFDFLRDYQHPQDAGAIQATLETAEVA